MTTHDQQQECFTWRAKRGSSRLAYGASSGASGGAVLRGGAKKRRVGAEIGGNDGYSVRLWKRRKAALGGWAPVVAEAGMDEDSD
jgi:hypothetical protein